MDLVPILGVSLWFVVKIIFLVGILVYVIFAAVVLKQVNLMTDTLQVGLEKTIRAVALIHFIIALAVFLLAAVIL